MSNYRVIVEGNSGDGFFYRIEDVYNKDGQLFITIEGPCSSVEQLESNLKERLATCSKPLMYVSSPELREIKRWLREREEVRDEWVVENKG